MDRGEGGAVAQGEGLMLPRATLSVLGAAEPSRMEFALKQAQHLAFMDFHTREEKCWKTH